MAGPTGIERVDVQNFSGSQWTIPLKRLLRVLEIKEVFSMKEKNTQKFTLLKGRELNDSNNWVDWIQSLTLIKFAGDKQIRPSVFKYPTNKTGV